MSEYKYKSIAPSTIMVPAIAYMLYSINFVVVSVSETYIIYIVQIYIVNQTSAHAVYVQFW
jgi:hypothetical protein